MANDRKNAKEIATEGIAGMSGVPVSVDDDLASLNPISKPGATDPYFPGGPETRNIGTRIPEINPTTEYGDLTIRPIATKKTATANKMTAVRAPKPPVNLNISGPKAMEEINTGWVKEEGAPLQYRQYTPTTDEARMMEKSNRKKKKAQEIKARKTRKKFN